MKLKNIKKLNNDIELEKGKLIKAPKQKKTKKVKQDEMPITSRRSATPANKPIAKGHDKLTAKEAEERKKRRNEKARERYAKKRAEELNMTLEDYLANRDEINRKARSEAMTKLNIKKKAQAFIEKYNMDEKYLPKVEEWISAYGKIGISDISQFYHPSPKVTDEKKWAENLFDKEQVKLSAEEIENVVNTSIEYFSENISFDLSDALDDMSDYRRERAEKAIEKLDKMTNTAKTALYYKMKEKYDTYELASMFFDSDQDRRQKANQHHLNDVVTIILGL